MCALVWVWRVYLSGGCRQGGDTKPNYEASMGTAVTTSSGLEPIQGTLTWANCAYLLMNLPRKGCPGTQHRLMTSATNFNHRLDCSFLSWHLVESKGILSPCQMSGLYFGPASSLTFAQCSVMTEILSPRAKIFTSNETMKTVATSLCSEYRGSKLLIIQEILDSFGFLHESVLDSKKSLELSSSCREGPG